MDGTGTRSGKERRPPGFTPRYASPEQRARVPVSTASDVYSLGILLSELLDGAADLDRPLPLRRRELAAIGERARREGPAERYPTVDALTADIRNFLDRQPVQALHGTTGYGSQGVGPPPGLGGDGRNPGAPGVWLHLQGHRQIAARPRRRAGGLARRGLGAPGALLEGEILEGLWFDRIQEYAARPPGRRLSLSSTRRERCWSSIHCRAGSI